MRRRSSHRETSFHAGRTSRASGLRSRCFDAFRNRTLDEAPAFRERWIAIQDLRAGDALECRCFLSNMWSLNVASDTRFLDGGFWWQGGTSVEERKPFPGPPPDPPHCAPRPPNHSPPAGKVRLSVRE